MTRRLVVTGAAGRMGRELIDAAAARGDVEVVFGVDQVGVDEVDGVPVRDGDGLADALADHEIDVLVDFSVPTASTEFVAACAEADVAAVVGTTGFDNATLSALREASEHVPVLKAANFSRGVLALRRAVREAVGALPGYDIEVTETHHNQKRDAPSGTAKRLLADIEESREDLCERTHGREGEQPRHVNEIGVHARRAGDVTGEHEVLAAGNHETLSLTHRAGSRGVFAAGALDSAAWLAGRDPGWYDFADVVDDGAADDGDSSTGGAST